MVGECCVGKRHFDCIGFVNWCFWRAMGNNFPGPARNSQRAGFTGIAMWRGSLCREINRAREQLETGDLLFDAELTHIGVVISATEVAHTAGHRWGVQVTQVSGPIYPHGAGAWRPDARRPRVLD